MELLGEQLAAHAAHLDAAMHRFLVDLRAFDDDQGWALQSAQSCAHWLAWRLGMDRGTAREHLRVARRLAELPLVDDALRRGAISYSKVRAITRVAVPATEAVLLGMAESMTANQLETTCRKLRMTQLQPADPNESTERRFLSRRDRDDGMTQIITVLRPDEAARLFSVLDAIAAERTREQQGRAVSAEMRSRSEGTRGQEADNDVSAETRSRSDREEPTRKIRGRRFDRCDALMEMVERQARGAQPERLALDLVVTVSAAALAGDPTAPLDRAGASADGTCLPLSTIRRLACDTGVVIVAEDEPGTPLSVGRKHRTVSGRLKRALSRRDPHCQFPGCANSVFMEAHHIEHWIDGGTTDLRNLINLCSHHHVFLHDHHVTVQAGKPPRFFDDLGRAIEHVPARPRPASLGWPAIRAANANLGIREDTNMCRWDGEDADYEAAIAELCRLEDQACEPDEWSREFGVPAETPSPPAHRTDDE